MASMEEKRTPMAWQHRDMNYHQGHQSAYNDRYGPAGMDFPVVRTGPPSSSDRLSHRTDKSWRTKESQPAPFRGAGTPGSASGYSRDPSGSHYAPSRPSYSTGRPASRPQSPGTTTETTSSSEDETATEDTRIDRGPPLSLQPPQSLYGYGGGYHPGGPMPPAAGFHPSQLNGYPGTMKSSKSVPAMTMATWNGEPCPVHGIGPFSMPGPMPPPMINPAVMYGHMGGPPSMGPPPMGPRRAASIYDMRHPAMMYGSLPPPRPPGDRRSIAGGPLSVGELQQNIPPQFLPPMARPRPVVVSEDGTAEPLPVRTPPQKNGSVVGLMSKMAREDSLKKKHKCTKGAGCVTWTIISVIFMGVVIGVLMSFIM